MSPLRSFAPVLLAASQLSLFGPATTQAQPLDKPTYHNDAARSGWNPHESLLTPAAVASPAFVQLWQTPQFDSRGTNEPRLFATPLYVDQVAISTGPHAGKTLSVIYAASDVGHVYAVNAFASADVPAGAILWSKRLTQNRPGSQGAISTPVIDLKTKRLYTVCADGNTFYQAHALDLGGGEPVAGWPVAIDAAAVNAPGINRNGDARFPNGLLIQRGALNLSPDSTRLYVTFAQGPSPGWIIALDTEKAAVATAFSATARTEEAQGGMWASGGPTVDPEGFVHIVTGSSVQVMIKKLGLPGIFPDSEHNWGQSVLRLGDDREKGFSLAGTYSPFNYAQAQIMDIDLGSSGATAIDLDPAVTATPKLLVLGGKQGNVYLLDRARMPGSLVKRPPPSEDSTTDGSLLPPEPQPQFGQRGPLNIFGPYADKSAANDQARSRITPAYFRAADGKHYVFMTGSAKTGPKLNVSTPPGLVRLEIITKPGEPAYLKVDQNEMTQVFHNPGSPVITSNGGRDAIVWVLDTNALRTAPMQGPTASRPVLYAFDALTFKLLWKSAPEELGSGGKYNEPTIVRGLVIVGTDRIQAFGLLPTATAARPVFPSPFPLVAAPANPPADPKIVQLGKTVYTQRCAACHSSGAIGVPAFDKITSLDETRIVETLTNGVMKPQAFGLKEREIKAIATYLTSIAATPVPTPAK
ncbi:MAG: cytochrome c [Opitutaceae bacterium]|nr:cytochrome c [Opitutaceae bacterium]